MCYLDLRDEREREWYHEEGFSFLTQYLEEIKVFGGEPFACRTSRAIILRRKASQTRTSFITNGTLLNAETIESLSRVRLGFVDVSLDAASETVYGRVRRPGYFQAAVQGLRRLVHLAATHSEGPFPVYADFAIQAANQAELSEFALFCNGVGAVAHFTLAVERPAAQQRAAARGWTDCRLACDIRQLLPDIGSAMDVAARLGASNTVASLANVDALVRMAAPLVPART
jgi:MoaA/NifB/PqqE/SkfB family radical SAM enzyme